MKKGKFGILLCFYPIAAFAAVILNSVLIAAALTAAAIFIEKDEWTGRQTLQACMAAVIVSFFRGLSLAADGLFYIPVVSSVLSAVTGILSFLVYLAAIVLSILSILRVAKDEEANFPLLSSLAYRVYGKVRPKPAPVQYTYQPMQQQPGAYPYPSPNGDAPQPQQPYAPPMYPPQNGQAPQYAPPMNTAQQPMPPVPPVPVQPPQTPPPADAPDSPASF